jgi:hypothetical protein
MFSLFTFIPPSPPLHILIQPSGNNRRRDQSRRVSRNHPPDHGYSSDRPFRISRTTPPNFRAARHAASWFMNTRAACNSRLQKIPDASGLDVFVPFRAR